MIIKNTTAPLCSLHPRIYEVEVFGAVYKSSDKPADTIKYLGTSIPQARRDNTIQEILGTSVLLS